MNEMLDGWGVWVAIDQKFVRVGGGGGGGEGDIAALSHGAHKYTLFPYCFCTFNGSISVELYCI